jgi:DNA repair exonuclease SbcCD ATPase subunit
VAEANESRARQLRELEEITARLHGNLVAEAERLRLLDAELRQREAKVQEVEGLYRQASELQRQAEAQAGETKRAAAELASRQGAAEKAEQRAREAQQQSEESILRAKRELAKTQAALEQLQAETTRVEAARSQAAAAQQEAQRLREETEKLQAQLWPAAVRGEAWRPWRERMVRRAAAEPPVAILLARLHTAAAFESCARPLALELVRDLGRAVYESCDDDAEKLAQALAQAAGGRFEIRTVRPGDRIDNKFMRPAASGLAEVRAVAGWAVRDANGLWQFPAEVS